ncbi:hypothetical protein KY284_036002 [Solanum tuberosum]|nr:hypothetical protein KY284_036002 [Solanum tuberosum]
MECAIVQIIGPTWRRFSIERVAHYFDINWKGQRVHNLVKQSFEKSEFMEREMRSRCYSQVLEKDIHSALLYGYARQVVDFFGFVKKKKEVTPGAGE